MLIDVAISGDRTTIKKEADTILEYEEFTAEIQGMWNVKTKVLPIIIKATRIISKSFTKYLSSILAEHDIEKLQTTAILGTVQYFGKY
jgi:hypothetical protein